MKERLKEYQSKISLSPPVDESELSELYGEFAEEDRELAEDGIADYAATLKKGTNDPPMTARFYAERFASIRSRREG